MEKSKIGFKTPDIFYDGKDKTEFEILEISGKDPKLEFNIKKRLKIKKYLVGKDLSFHTQTSRIFSCKNKECNLPEFNEAELDVLKAEIILCKILGIKEFIFHLKQEKLTEKEVETFEEILKFARKKKVEMIYEPNGFFNGNNFVYNLNKFRGLKANLDLGHLNNAIGSKTLEMDLDEFIEEIKDRVIYIHAHNNNGKEDEHKSLDEGTLDWKNILNRLNFSKIRKIIMEVKTTEAIKKSKKLLEQYLIQKGGKNGKK